MLPIYMGFDPREACVYHVCCESIIEHARSPVSFIPLNEQMLNGFDGQQDGSNSFIYSRYLVPYLNGFHGAAVFLDGDMHVTSDINELIDLFDPRYAVQVVKHDYKTKSHRKYIGTPLENDNVDYPRKNWSSVMIFNCAHPSNRILTPEFVGDAGGAFLHRFQWLKDEEIGELPAEWNHLVTESEPKDAKLYHHTLGTPGFKEYAQCESARDWNSYLLSMLNLEGERQSEVVRRAHWHCKRHLRNAS